MLDRLVGKWDYSYLLLCGVPGAKPVIFAVTCFHQPHTCCLQLCYAKVFDPGKQLGHVTVKKKKKKDDKDEMFGMFSLEFFNI